MTLHGITCMTWHGMVPLFGMEWHGTLVTLESWDHFRILLAACLSSDDCKLSHVLPPSLPPPSLLLPSSLPPPYLLSPSSLPPPTFLPRSSLFPPSPFPPPFLVPPSSLPPSSPNSWISG
ncbi:unnamed protein product [Closterium sp. NIES-53]